VSNPPSIDPEVQQALGIVARRAKDLSLHERLGARVGYPLECPYFGTLSRLATTGTATVSELAALLNLELSTVSRRVRVLEERRLIEREPGADRRTSHLRLTAEGQQMFDALEKGWRQMLSEVVADWDPADVAQFSELFVRFAADFDRYADGVTGSGQADPPPAASRPAGRGATRGGRPAPRPRSARSIHA
jgi:DNA-binding MarR family transcriptional regulator